MLIYCCLQCGESLGGSLSCRDHWIIAVHGSLHYFPRLPNVEKEEDFVDVGQILILPFNLNPVDQQSSPEKHLRPLVSWRPPDDPAGQSPQSPVAESLQCQSKVFYLSSFWNVVKSTSFGGCLSQIVDIYDDSLYDEILIDPFAWLNETMAIQDLRVLIIDSPQLKLSSLVKDEELECLQHSNGLEGIVRYAIRQLWLRQASNHSLYSSTFFVGYNIRHKSVCRISFPVFTFYFSVFRFSSQPSFHDESANLHLTPLRHFLLPAHLSELFMYINSWPI